jgi:hypothetical protein
MTILTPPGDSGEARRDAALAQLSARRPAIIRDIQRAAVRLALDLGNITADDIRAAVTIPPGVRPTVVGAAVRVLAIAGIIRKIDFRPSRRPVAHARPLTVWALTDHAAALRWLADHPALPKPAEGGGG